MSRSLSPDRPMNSNHPEHDLDRWFGAYFQAQMPKPFPPAPQVASVEPARPRQSNTTGRWTLALTVAASLVLGITFSYGPTVTAPSGESNLLEDSTANGNKLQNHMPKPAKMP